MSRVQAVDRAAPGSAPWMELDVLRGLAVIAMVTNHAVARWHVPGEELARLTSLLFEIGGFAPVLFFFATGFGSGLQSLRARGSGQHRYGFGRKIAILVFADQFILWRFGVHSGQFPRFGLDFLGFIALSTLAVEPLRSAQRGTLLALLGVVFVVFVRFFLSPWLLPDVVAAPDLHWFGILTGRVAVRGLAYPPFPWLMYPLLGFALGRSVGRERAVLGERPVAVYTVLGVGAALAFATTRGLAGVGMDVSRYGIHSLAYLPLALGALAVAIAASWAICRAAASRSAPFGAVERGIAIRGVASLAVVPLHFAVVFAVGLRMKGGPSDSAIVLGALLTIAACLAGGRAFSDVAERIERNGAGRLARRIAGAVVAASTLAIWWPLTVGPISRHSAVYVAQLCLCGLLVWSPGRASRS